MPPRTQPKSVVIVEDQTAVRELITEMLESRGKFAVKGSTGDGTEGVELALRHQPDVLILDINLPGISGIEVLRRLHDEVPKMRVLVFSGKTERQIAHGLLKQGVCGFVNKTSPLSELREALDAVADGKTWFTESYQKALADALDSPESLVDEKGSALSDREREVAVLLAQSHSSKEVAALLKISAKTVENHRTNLMRKLGVHDVAGVIRYVVRQGLFDPSSQP